VAAGRVEKADEDEELEVFSGVESSLEWESKKLVMGAWKRRRLVIDSMMMGWEGARLGDCWSVWGWVDRVLINAATAAAVLERCFRSRNGCAR
jgi:hypothetical protein